MGGVVLGFERRHLVDAASKRGRENRMGLRL